MAEPARRTSVANKALAEQLAPEKAVAPKAVPAGDNAADNAAAAPAAPSRRQRLGAWLTRQPSRGVLLGMLGVSLLFNGWGLVRLRGQRDLDGMKARAAEVDLGNFVYRSQDATVSLQEARFSLALALLDETDAVTRQSLDKHRRRVRQAVEELLRTANNDDFDDPNLLGLKRRLEERINGVVGGRGIAEVIITELVANRGSQPGGLPVGLAGSSSPPPGAP